MARSAAILSLVLVLAWQPARHSAPDAGAADHYGAFFARLDAAMPPPPARSGVGRFTVRSARWNPAADRLEVRLSTVEPSGELIVLTGLPASSWIAEHRLTAEHQAKFDVTLPATDAVPCRVMIRSSVMTRTIDVANAPDACSRRITVRGSVDERLVRENRIVTALVDGRQFRTNVDAAGHYAMEVYAESNDPEFSISIEGAD